MGFKLPHTATGGYSDFDAFPYAPTVRWKGEKGGKERKGGRGKPGDKDRDTVKGKGFAHLSSDDKQQYLKHPSIRRPPGLGSPGETDDDDFHEHDVTNVLPYQVVNEDDEIDIDEEECLEDGDYEVDGVRIKKRK